MRILSAGEVKVSQTGSREERNPNRNGAAACALDTNAAVGSSNLSLTLRPNRASVAMAAHLESIKWALLPFLVLCAAFLLGMVVVCDYSISIKIDCPI